MMIPISDMSPEQMVDEVMVKQRAYLLSQSEMDLKKLVIRYRLAVLQSALMAEAKLDDDSDNYVHDSRTGQFL